jgi:hypothetical protein
MINCGPDLFQRPDVGLHQPRWQRSSYRSSNKFSEQERVRANIIATHSFLLTFALPSDNFWPCRRQISAIIDRVSNFSIYFLCDDTDATDSNVKYIHVLHLVIFSDFPCCHAPYYRDVHLIVTMLSSSSYSVGRGLDPSWAFKTNDSSTHRESPFRAPTYQHHRRYRHIYVHQSLSTYEAIGVT